MTEEERALIIVELRLRGAHPSYIEFWLRVYPRDLLDLHRRNWHTFDGQPWQVEERWKGPFR